MCQDLFPPSHVLIIKKHYYTQAKCTKVTHIHIHRPTNTDQLTQIGRKQKFKSSTCSIFHKLAHERLQTESTVLKRNPS